MDSGPVSTSTEVIKSRTTAVARRCSVTPVDVGRSGGVKWVADWQRSVKGVKVMLLIPDRLERYARAYVQELFTAVNL